MLFMEDLVTKAQAKSITIDMLPTIAVGTRRALVLTPDGELEDISHDAAAERVSRTPHLMVNMPLVARRLGLGPIRAYDTLELYAYVRPARFCLPTIGGLLSALMVDIPQTSLEDQVIAVKATTQHLLADLGSETYRYRAGAMDVCQHMAKSGWLFGPLCVAALEGQPDMSRENGIMVWTALPDWEDQPPKGPPDNHPITGDEAVIHLKSLLREGSEEREQQTRYTQAAVHAFSPSEFMDGPNLQLLEAGTGTGKTLGYIAPAVLWARKNNGAVWLSTFTKNLQRQIDQELSTAYPDPRVKAKKAVMRKGRENYACLLNIEETLKAVMMRAGGERDKILLGLVLRWVRYSRDGDMIGGDFPGWLGGHFGAGRISGLTDRRGECLYAACQHYRKCFIEKAVRKAKGAEIVVANHALVMAQAANRFGDPDLPSRIVFDEGHHVFDAADSAFSSHLTGMEGAELRRWLRGKESGGSSRARGIKSRLEELIASDSDAKAMLEAVIHSAHVLPAEAWLSRVSGTTAHGSYEIFLNSVRTHVLSRSDTRGFHSLEAAINDPSEQLVEHANALSQDLDTLARPMAALASRLIQLLDEEADSLDSNSRARLESSARALMLRSEQVKGWTHMTLSLGGTTSDEYIDWFEIDRVGGSDRDIGHHRHFIDPTKAFAEVVLEPTKGALITSATLRDKGELSTDTNDDWISADSRTGVQHMTNPPKRLSVNSPFDYAKQSRVIIVTDVNKNEPSHVAAAYRELMLASGGGALGLFTAISRLKAAYAELAGPLDEAGIPLYSQHVDPMDASTLVDVFRQEEDACLLGTDAVRDGVDVPGKSLRLIVFDRVPWPRPTILHRARRAAFGAKHYDEMLTRLKLIQAFGRLIRNNGDKGIFVMLDNQTPSRLLAAFPQGVEPQRMGLSDALSEIKIFLKA